jgi:hypothetical protein
MPVPIMFAITMQVAVSREMRWGLLGMSLLVREKFRQAQPIPRGKISNKLGVNRDNQTFQPL